MKRTILIVDDDEEICVQMKWALAEDYEILLAANRDEAIEQFRSGQPDVTLLDLGLPPHPNSSEEGFATLDNILELDRFAKVLVVSGQADQVNARRAVAAGAHDILGKPISDMEGLKLLLQRCIYLAEVQRESREQTPEAAAPVFEGMLGSSGKLQAVIHTIKKVATTDASVLILGESGTGKEMVARAIHAQSALADERFVAINCSAIPESLIESELFGYEKGAFTGAQNRSEGLIESAKGGTLFLDELGDLPAAIQVKLLRFLQERCIQRVGGREEIPVEARVLAATHVDLEDAVREGTFREDLYFRLAVVVCRVPALRERGEDVLILADDFLKRFTEQTGCKSRVFSGAARKAIARHGWPGNVRELQNRVQRAVIMADGDRIGVNDLELRDSSDMLPSRTLREAREDVERDLMEQALQKHGGKITAVASELGVSRPTVYELLDKLGIERKSGKKP